MEELQGGYYFEQTEPKAKVEIRSKIHSTHELGKRAVVQRNQNVFIWIRRKKYTVFYILKIKPSIKSTPSRS